MLGITAYGAYIPYNRLERRKIGQAFGDRFLPGEKAVANFDEDSLSLAVSAALDCIAEKETKSINALFFATTTAPYDEKQSSATMAYALDVPNDIRTSDFTGSLRAASSALLAAFDAVKSGAENVLVGAADSRLGAPQGTNEQLFGDAAAAFLIGQGDAVIARVIGVYSHVQEQIGNWRNHGDVFVGSWEDRFVNKAHTESVTASVRGLLAASGLQPADFAKAVIAGPSSRAQKDAAASLGFTKEQFQDPLIDQIGMVGTAHGPLMLAAAMDEAKPGDRILFVNHGEGSDAVAFEVTEAITKLPARRGVRKHLTCGSTKLAYTDYLKWKGILSTEPARRPETPRPSVPAMYRNYQQNLALYGSLCMACSTPQFPKQRVCVQCQTRDNMKDYRFYGRTAKVATFTVDYLAASPAPPTVVAVVDFVGGGRMMCEVTDCEPSEIHIGQELEMTFRRLYEAGGIHNYFWKAKPKR